MASGKDNEFPVYSSIVPVGTPETAILTKLTMHLSFNKTDVADITVHIFPPVLQYFFFYSFHIYVPISFILLSLSCLVPTLTCVLCMHTCTSHLSIKKTGVPIKLISKEEGYSRQKTKSIPVFSIKLFSKKT